MIFLVATNNPHIVDKLNKKGTVIAVKNAEQLKQYVKDEEFDDIVISDPYDKNEALIADIIAFGKEPVIIHTKEDFVNYLKTFSSNSANATPVIKKELPQNRVLLVTTNRNTIDAFQGFNILIATTPFSATQHLQYSQIKAVVWDLPAEPIKTEQHLYVWGREIKGPDDLEFALKHGNLKISESKTVNNINFVPVTPESEINTTKPTEIYTKPIEDELEAIHRIKETPSKPEPPPIKTKPVKSEVKELPKEVTPPKIQKPKPKPKKEKTEKGFALFIKTGVITGNKFVKIKFDKAEEITIDYDALVIPASKGIKYVKEYRRENPLKPIVVIKGDQAFIEAGADKCVKKINKSVIAEMTHLSNVIKNLWSRMETDPLTGLYTRTFLNEWKQNREERGKNYTAVMLDIDKFKNINDTFGHDAGDAVLAALGDYLKSETRVGDIVARYGGEEFVICLPDTTANEGYILVDRIRHKWSERAVMHNGKTIQSTFSAGVAEWRMGVDTIKTADEMLYQAKNNGRNRVVADGSKVRALLLGKMPLTEFHNNNIEITYDPELADVVVADKTTYTYAPTGVTLYVLGDGGVSDWVLKRDTGAYVFPTILEIIHHIKGKPKLQVLPGVRTQKNSQTIPKHGALYVICPSRPAAAGELAVQLSRSINNVGFVCASGSSTSAKILGIPDRTLIKADWRLLGSDAPIDWEGMKVWPVDPFKHITTRYDIHKLVDQIKNYFDLVIVDCAGSLDLCQRIAYDEGVLLLYREGDASDTVTANWAKTFNAQSIMAISPSEEPSIIEAENGYIISYRSINKSSIK